MRRFFSDSVKMPLKMTSRISLAWMSEGLGCQLKKLVTMIP